MAIKKYKPVTPSRRQMSDVKLGSILTAKSSHKPLTRGMSRSVGRNNAGRITVRHKGGGHKRLFRDIDFLLDKKDVPFVVESIEYDPNRSGLIGLVVYRDGARRYVLLPKGAQVGASYLISENAPVKTGTRLPLKNISVGTFVFNVELKKDGGAKMGRSAGNYIEVLAKDGGLVDLKMPSTEIRKVSENCWATVGEVSNEEHHLVNFGKAGRSRWLGIRPTVRGSAMNPVDHPYGGGEARSGRGLRRAKSAWGRPTGKGQKSRRAKKYSNISIVSRRKVGKRR
ncbi:MAG: 50S ribosomal protein L2 [Candidatus Zambryskibacteria bacterium RIFCSPHIGHO2_12_FULL_44_12b]|nr:MAG: 50S ribosomal protein L2 [Candidatus Zambryskibacteria bacterium RIFCSPHIGHO2_12_FULL_44_12b]